VKKIFRISLIILNIIAAVSLALACVCCFVNPKTIWWIGFFGLVYRQLLAVNICFIVFWAFSRKKKWMVISTVTILIGWAFVGKNLQLFEKKIPAEELEKSFKVISFNVEGFKKRNTKQPDGQMLNIFDYLREKDADIICMQEFILNPRSWGTDLNKKDLLKQFEKTPFFHINYQGEGWHCGIATFSKYPIISKELVYADGSTNACMYSDLLIGADTVRVYNGHLKSVGFQNHEKQFLKNVVKTEYNRSDIRAIITILRQMKAASVARARQVEILSSHIAQSPYPVIICGDFNDPPTSFSYRKVRGKRKDAFVEAGSGRGTTYNIGRITSLRIDFILYSDVFKAYSYESPRVLLSDHFPVMCRLVKQE